MRIPEGMHATDCPRERDLPAFLQDELTEAERRSLEDHLRTCAWCRDALDDYRQMITAVREAPVGGAPVDVRGAVLARLERSRTRRYRLAWARRAALWVVLLGSALLAARLLRQAPPRGSTATGARVPARTATRQGGQWLVARQRPDGRWDAGDGDRPTRYAVGLTALSMMALDGADGEEADGATRRAAVYLADQQSPEGFFGPRDSATMYNTALAVVALLQSGGAASEPALRGLEFICSSQRPGGGWGYVRASREAMNTSITVWQLLALMQAEACGRTDLRARIERGLAWLESTIDDQGRVGYSARADFPYGYETMTAAGALCALKQRKVPPHLLRAFLDVAEQSLEPDDMYRTYFVAAALRAFGTSEASGLLEELRAQITGRQVVSGPEAGSWETADRWSTAGGRVYATAMAMLALEAGTGRGLEVQRYN